MFKQCLVFIILPVLISSCGVDRNKVTDSPPQFLRTAEFNGEVFGHISIYNQNKLDYGNSFSVFLWPEAERHKSSQYTQSVEDLRQISRLLDPMTQAQLANTQMRLYRESCGLQDLKPEVSRSKKDFRCTELYAYKEYEPRFQYCGIESLKEDEVPTEQQCGCLESNNQHIREIFERYQVKNLDELILDAKLQFAECAWRLIDPQPYEKTSNVKFIPSKNWFLGDDIDINGNKKGGDSDNGSHLAIISDGLGGAKVVLDIVNLNGVPYTTEEREPKGKWGEIRNASYEVGKALLTFELIERDRKSGVETGRIFEFKMTRTQPFSLEPNFHRFNGDVLVKMNGETVRNGSAKFDGYLQNEMSEEILKNWVNRLELNSL